MATSRCWRSCPANPRLRTRLRLVKIRYRASPVLAQAPRGHERSEPAARQNSTKARSSSAGRSGVTHERDQVAEVHLQQQQRRELRRGGPGHPSHRRPGHQAAGARPRAAVRPCRVAQVRRPSETFVSVSAKPTQRPRTPVGALSSGSAPMVMMGWWPSSRIAVVSAPSRRVARPRPGQPGPDGDGLGSGNQHA